MRIYNRSFGSMPDGRPIDIIEISNSNGISIQVIPYGATLVSVKMPDARGKIDEITLGYDSIEGYLGDHPYFGATVGRVVNRIKDAQFFLGRRSISVTQNYGQHCLHGGKNGFNRFLWRRETFGGKNEAGVRCSRVSPHGEEGFPGNLKTDVAYRLNEDNELWIDYFATTDRTTPINLTNHAYWNLRGTGTILNHEMVIYADRYLGLDSDLIATGEVISVDFTALDFRRRRIIGERLTDVPNGYDFAYVLGSRQANSNRPARRSPPGMQPAAFVIDPVSKRSMEVYTTKPTLQFYTGNSLAGSIGRDGKPVEKYSAFCLETQYYPNAVNIPDFPSTILKRNVEYRHHTMHHFDILL